MYSCGSHSGSLHLKYDGEGGGVGGQCESRVDDRLIRLAANRGPEISLNLKKNMKSELGKPIKFEKLSQTEF